MNARWLWFLSGLVLPAAACGSDEDDAKPPPCGSFENGLITLIPGPGQAGFDDGLARVAHDHDRLFHAVYAIRTGLNANFRYNDTEAKRAFTRFVEADGFDFQEVTGQAPEDLGAWAFSPGDKSGPGVAADAYRYGVLRDSGADCQEIEVARQQLIRGLEGLDVAARIGGVPGVMARGVVHPLRPMEGHGETTPLFDEHGAPLPEPKDNGTWRADASGDYPGWFWVDSMSRDMLIGWSLGYSAAWEVIRNDETYPDELKGRLQENARNLVHNLMLKNDEGYDLEIQDADGRPTFHASINENYVDRLLIDGVEYGFNAIMALGTVGAFSYVAEDQEIAAYLHDELIGRRNLPRIAEKEMLFQLGVGSNFSAYDMAFTAMYLAGRFIDDPDANALLRITAEHELYNKPEVDVRRPIEMGQSLFDFVYAVSATGNKADRPTPDRSMDWAAVDRGLATLGAFPLPPVFEETVINCDEQEIEAGTCTLNDGTEVQLFGYNGWNDELVADRPIPMEIRPFSDYYWRDNPYTVNGEAVGNRLMPAVDFRVVYWMGRWVRVPERS